MGGVSSKPFQQLLVSDVVAKQNLLKIDANQSIRGALDVLAKHRILSAPVHGPNGDLGFLDVLDIVAFLSTNYLGGTTSFIDEENMDAPCKNAIDSSGRNPVLYVHHKTPINIVLEKMAKEKVHRLAVCDESDSKHSNILHIVSQTDVFAQIAMHAKEIFPESYLKKKIGELRLGYRHVATCNLNDSTADSFWKMIAKNYSSLGVVDKEGKLVGVLSGSEIRGLTEHNLNVLTLTVGEFLERRQVKSFRTCTPDETLDSIMQKVYKERLHRIFIVDKQDMPIGLLTLTDFIYQLYLKQQE